MRYSYVILSPNGVRIEEHIKHKAVHCDFEQGASVLVICNLTNRDVVRITLRGEWEIWCEDSNLNTGLVSGVNGLRAALPKAVVFSSADKLVTAALGQPDEEKDHINPSHYQGYCQDLQWLETMQYLPHFREPEAFKAAVELQARKYLDRSGGKDDELQETKKAIWYLKFLAAYMANGNKPIRVKDIEALLA